jgi:AraC-like DNA-binding protein
LTLTDLAGIACLSPYHFSRSFKEAVGIGPQRYVMQRRLERAKTLIRRTNQPLAEIAHQVGLCDQSHLTSMVRRETGETSRSTTISSTTTQQSGSIALGGGSQNGKGYRKARLPAMRTLAMSTGAGRRCCCW